MKQQHNLDMAPFHCPPTCEHAGTSSLPSRPPRLTGTWQLSSPRAVRRNSFHHQGGSTSLHLQKQRGSHASASQMPKAALSPTSPWRPATCLALKLCGACQRWGAPGTEAKHTGQPPWGEGRGLRPSCWPQDDALGHASTGRLSSSAPGEGQA